MTTGELSILIVDDDREDIVLTKRIIREGLKALALDLDAADSYLQGLRLVATRPYDLLFFDYHLGEKNGLDLIREVRSQGIDTPVILLTGRGDEEIAVEAMKLGASDYLPKAKLSQTLVRTSVRYAIELHHKETQRLRMEQDLRKTNADLEGWVTELKRLNELGNLLQSCSSLDQAYSVIAHRSSEFFPDRAGALCMLDASRTIAQVVAAWGKTPPHTRGFSAADCLALSRGAPVCIGGSGTGPVCPLFQGSPSGTHFCVPMSASGEVSGVLVLQGNEQSGEVVGQGADDTRVQAQWQFARALAEQVALGLANLRLREILRSQAIHDALTGLFNRRHMEEFLAESASSAQRENRPLAILMLDLDHFKTFNDTEGHLAGDSMLRFMGRFLQMHSREEDIACRYGGDEFVLILPGVPLAVAVQRAEQMRLTLKTAQPRTGWPWNVLPTMSVGISTAPQQGFSAERLLALADAALYKAKAEGRDRVVVSQEPNLSDQVSAA